MDFDRLSDTIHALYIRLGPFPYSAEEYINVFRYYFAKYQAVTGWPHPPVKWEQILRIMEIMPYSERYHLIQGDIYDIPPDMYPEIIDLYFSTPFRNCDYRINHFFSGDIRNMRIYELLY